MTFLQTAPALLSKSGRGGHSDHCRARSDCLYSLPCFTREASAQSAAGIPGIVHELTPAANAMLLQIGWMYLAKPVLEVGPQTAPSLWPGAAATTCADWPCSSRAWQASTGPASRRHDARFNMRISAISIHRAKHALMMLKYISNSLQLQIN